jgi:hypothetical protein
MKQPLALAMMVVKLLDKSTVILTADSVLALAHLKMIVLEPKVPTAWPMVSALTAETMLIVPLVMLGVETEFPDVSVSTNFAHLPVMPIVVLLVTTLVEMMPPIATMMEPVSGVPLILNVHLLMVLLPEVETLSVMPLVSA